MNSGQGIYLYSGCNNRNRILNNSIYNTKHYGIFIEGSKNVTVGNNIIISTSRKGIKIYYSSNCMIYGNIIMGNGIFIEGRGMKYWNSHYIDTSNTINGKPVYYLKNLNGEVIPEGAGEIILVNCSNITIKNQNITNTNPGIEVGYSSHIYP